MASSSSAVNDSVILTEDDIPGASLAGRNPSSLKNEELRFWLRCREDSLKGLKKKPADSHVVVGVVRKIEMTRDWFGRICVVLFCVS